LLHSVDSSQSSSTTATNVDVPLTERLLNGIGAYEQIPMPNVESCAFNAKHHYGTAQLLYPETVQAISIVHGEYNSKLLT